MSKPKQPQNGQPDEGEKSNGFTLRNIAAAVVVGVLIAAICTYAAWRWNDTQALKSIPVEIRHRLSLIDDEMMADDPNAAFNRLNGVAPEHCRIREYEAVGLLTLLDMWEDAGGEMTRQTEEDRQYAADIINDKRRSDPKVQSYFSDAAERLVVKLKAWFPE